MMCVCVVQLRVCVRVCVRVLVPAPVPERMHVSSMRACGCVCVLFAVLCPDAVEGCIVQMLWMDV